MDTPTIIITGGKGGTGKTLTAANLAMRLSQNYQVGVLDADIDSPNLPEVMGVKGQLEVDGLMNFIPVEVSDNLRMFSMRLFADDNEGGFSKSGEQHDQIIHDAINHTTWGHMDFFIVDLPAGSSDEFRAMLKKKRLTNIVGLVIVSMPNTVTDLKRIAELASVFKKPVIGVVENLTHVTCPCGCDYKIPLFGGKNNTRIVELCAELHLPYLGGIPYMPAMHERNGESYILTGGDAAVIDQIMEEIGC